MRKGRLSIAGAFYFVTFCTAQRKPVLIDRQTIAAIHTVFRQLVQSEVISELTATAMPDHLHLLFRLGDRLSLDRTISKFKAQAVRSTTGTVWQENFFEHRLRPDESTEPYAWYIFMNPYRAGLIPCESPWSGWWTDGRVPYEFISQSRPGPCPQPEWLDHWSTKTRDLATGAD